MMFPVKIQRLRINVSIKHFYEDLQTFCKTMNWKYEKPEIFPADFKSDKIHWKNNMIAFSEVSSYANNSLKEIHITYSIPSFIDGPNTVSEKFESILLPKIGFKHVISLFLSQEYPKNVAKTHIQSVSTLWHNNFYFYKNRYAHGCVLISGEIDGMSMNLFQQLLWNPDFVWQNAHKTSNFSLNYSAFNYAKLNGFDFPYRVLINQMNKNFGI